MTDRRAWTPNQRAQKLKGQKVSMSFGDFPTAYCLIYGHVSRADAIRLTHVPDDKRILVSHEWWSWRAYRSDPETGEAYPEGMFMASAEGARGAWEATVVRPALGHDRFGLEPFFREVMAAKPMAGLGDGQPDRGDRVDTESATV